MEVTMSRTIDPEQFLVCVAMATLRLAGCTSDYQPMNVPPPPLAAQVQLTNLVENAASSGVTADTNLIDPWGLALSSTGALWVADNHTGLATVYNGDGETIPLTVTIPAPSGGTAVAAPTGQVFNSLSTDFMGDMFILATENGTIAGWQTGTTATLRADSASGAVYKGLDILDTGAGRVIVTADFSSGTVDVFDTSYRAIALSGGSFVDPDPIAGFAPFNILVVGDSVYVAYAKQDTAMQNDVSGPGNGAIDVFDNTGNFVRRLITGGALDSPWGLAIAPSDYPVIGGDLLVGNFGDGRISAIDTMSGALQTQLEDDQGNPLTIPGLWALRFGDDQVGESHLQIFFSAGPEGQLGGVLGRLDTANPSSSGGGGTSGGGGGGGYGGGYGY
jgi:uncharacterized protein (TIGR03118 family)